MRTIILGSPRAGKSTLARKLLDAATSPPGTMLWHLDELVASHAWSEQSEVAARYLTEAIAPFIVEGCAGSRALRKWLERDLTGGVPVDSIIRLATPRVELTPGQERMRKGEATIWRDVEALLTTRDASHIVTYL